MASSSSRVASASKSIKSVPLDPAGPGADAGVQEALLEGTLDKGKGADGPWLLTSVAAASGALRLAPLAAAAALAAAELAIRRLACCLVPALPVLASLPERARTAAPASPGALPPPVRLPGVLSDGVGRTPGCASADFAALLCPLLRPPGLPAQGAGWLEAMARTGGSLVPGCWPTCCAMACAWLSMYLCKR